VTDLDGVATAVPAIQGLEAYMHLVRGNLGPGTLNLPFAFARVGWVRGLVMLLAVTSQGCYSKLTLVQCKRALHEHGPQTYMEVANLTLGRPGRAAIQIFIATMQLGVCCVFLQLISTNLEAGLRGMGAHVPLTACTLMVTVVLVLLSMLRRIRHLKWLTMTANLMMGIALVSATIEAWVVLKDSGKQPKPGSGAPEDVFFFLSSMFYAYEGIAIVLPVENSFCRGREHSLERYQEFRCVLLKALVTLSSFMLGVGASCGVAFPNIESGSITAYLSTERPNPWFKIINALTLLAVLMTFPLQLYPVTEVLNEWFGPGCRPRCCISGENNQSEPTGHVPLETSESNIDDISTSQNPHDMGVEATYGCKYEWIVRRTVTIIGCAGVALCVNNLALLVALCGSVGSPGLIMMPSVIHLRLSYKGVISICVPALVMDSVAIVFSIMVGFTGAYFAISQLINDPQPPKL